MLGLLTMTEQIFPLQQGTSAIVGRAQDSVVRIWDDSCSKHHARLMIGFTPRDHFIEDLNSRNGTFLNEVRVTAKQALNHQDVIRVGQQKLMFLCCPDSEDLPQWTWPQGSLEHTKEWPLEKVTKESPMTRKLERDSDDSVFSGDLSALPILEILQILTNSKRSGTLVAQLPDGVAEIDVVSGDIHGATYSGVHGMPALFAIVLRSSGHFEFLESKKERKRTVLLPTARVLFELCRVLDESGA